LLPWQQREFGRRLGWGYLVVADGGMARYVEPNVAEPSSHTKHLWSLFTRSTTRLWTRFTPKENSRAFCSACAVCPFWQSCTSVGPLAGLGKAMSRNVVRAALLRASLPDSGSSFEVPDQVCRSMRCRVSADKPLSSTDKPSLALTNPCFHLRLAHGMQIMQCKCHWSGHTTHTAGSIRSCIIYTLKLNSSR
jgi:hypothetical protein